MKNDLRSNSSPLGGAETLRERLRLAATGLVNALPDCVLETIRQEWGNSNVSVIKHWRELTREALATYPLGRIEPQEGWQPIATAPKDHEVLLRVEWRAGIPGKMLVGHYQPGGHCIEDHPAIDEGWYFWNGCMFDRASKPTHWMPLPAPPVASEGQEPPR